MDWQSQSDVVLQENRFYAPRKSRSELQTVLTKFEPRVALVAPAFPAMGRLLVNERLQLNWTESIHLPWLLQAQGVAAVAHIDQRLLLSGTQPVVEHIQFIGSTNPVTRRQLEQLAEHREVCFLDLRVNR